MRISDADMHWARPTDPAASAVLVLAGSSGRMDAARAQLIAREGATALALRWFGGSGQPERACGVPIEMFLSATEMLRRDADRVSILGLSYGAEAALIAASLDSRIDAVVALAPTHLTWQGDRASQNCQVSSKWTYGGTQLPFVPLTERDPADNDEGFADWYERSIAVVSAQTLGRATIAVDQITGDVVLVAGGSDAVWPSLASARQIERRRSLAGLPTTVVADPDAGHLIVLPGEEAVAPMRPYPVGDLSAGVRLGAAAWPHIRTALGLAD